MSKSNVPQDPFGQPRRDEADPEAQGLPPQVQLPDRQTFRRGQLWARLVVSLVGLLTLAIFYFVVRPADRPIVLACVLLVAVIAVVQVVRYLRERSVDEQAGPVSPHGDDASR